MSTEKGEATQLFSRRSRQRGTPPSAWFSWNARIFGPRVRVLDIACGAGRHTLPAAELGADVVAADSNGEAISTLEREAARRKLAIKCLHLDLKTSDIAPESFDVVMMFNYLDRKRFADFRNAVRPGGYFLAETFLEGQKEQGWGPQSDDHLLKNGELLDLVVPFDVFLSREVLEMVDGRPASVASVLAQRPPK